VIEIIMNEFINQQKNITVTDNLTKLIRYIMQYMYKKVALLGTQVRIY